MSKGATMSELALAAAVETVCDEDLPRLTRSYRMAIKLAVMMRMGLSNPIALANGIMADGLEFPGTQFQHLVVAGGLLMNEPLHQPLLDELESKTHTLLAAFQHQQRGRA